MFCTKLAFEPNYRLSDEESAKARKAVRSSNFTQQSNTLDVDKHMFVGASYSSRILMVL